MARRSSKLCVFFLLAVVVANALVAGVNGQSGRRWQGDEEETGSHGGRGGGRESPEEQHGGGGGGGGRGRTESRKFILYDTERVVATTAGGMRVVRGVGGKLSESPMHIGFITMEPNSLFIPQYLDSSLIIFVELGEARIGSIYKDKFVEKDLKAGDLYRIQAGSAFYLVNTAQGQRLHIITSIDTAESSDWSVFQAFYIGGGTNPASVLAGFDKQTLVTALNVSSDVVDQLLYSSRQKGAIVHLNPANETQDEPNMWNKFLEQGKHERKMQMKRIVPLRRTVDDEEEKPVWSLRKLFISLFGENSKDDDLDAYNIYDEKPDFKNDYGWSTTVDGDDYEPLKESNFGVYLVNLSAGSMMAPHINPSAIEYGIVLSGRGNIQVVYPNGTLAMNAEVSEGDVFWIPRYFPFCQVASRSKPFVFFGFTTSCDDNMPQFLVGKDSLLQIMMGPELAASFGSSEKTLTDVANAQHEKTIIPAATASPGGGSEEIPEGQGKGGDRSEGESKGGESMMEKMEAKIRMKKSSFGYNMAMGLD